MDTEKLYKGPCRTDSVNRRHEDIMEMRSKRSARRVN
jgi:hypothetical protein